MSLIPPELAAVLVCTVDKGPLIEDEARSCLTCTTCGRRYPVRDGIPFMRIEDAEGGPADD